LDNTFLKNLEVFNPIYKIFKYFFLPKLYRFTRSLFLQALYFVFKYRVNTEQLLTPSERTSSTLLKLQYRKQLVNPAL